MAKAVSTDNLDKIKAYIDSHGGGSGWTKVIDVDFDGTTTEWVADVPEGTREVLFYGKDMRIVDDSSYGVLNITVNGVVGERIVPQVANTTAVDGTNAAAYEILIGSALVRIGNMPGVGEANSKHCNVPAEAIHTIGIKDNYGGVYAVKTGHMEVWVR